MKNPQKSKALKALQAGLLASTLLAAPAFGARLAYEGFDYAEADGTSIVGLNGGTGWDEPFPAVSGTIALQPGLSFTGITTVGKAMRWNPNANTGQGRDWQLNPTAAPANGTYWFSVIVNANQSSQGNFNWMYSTKSTNGQNGVGVRTSNTGGALNFKPVNPNIDGAASMQAGTGTVGTPTFIVGRLNLTVGSDSAFRIWVNPSTDPNTIPGDGDSNSSQTTVSAADTATLRASIAGRAFGTSPGYVEYDEIRIATSFSQVLPPQPGVAEFEMDPLQAIENQNLTFNWSNLPPASNPTLNGSSVTIDGSGAGTTTLSAPAVNTTYTLAWTGVGSPLTQDFTAIAPSFTFSPASGYLGDTLPLNWRIPVGSTGATLNPGAVDLTSFTSATTGAGSTTIAAPSSNTNYTLSYTFGGNPFTLNKDFTLLPSFLAVIPAQAISGQTPLALTWRIPPSWDENTTAANTVILRYGSPQSFIDDTYFEQDLTLNTDPATGAGSHPKSSLFDSAIIPAAGETEYRIVYNIAETPQTLTDTITLQPLVIQIDDFQNAASFVTINNAPLADGVLAYLDRGHVWAEVPSILEGAQFVKLSQADKTTAAGDPPPHFNITFTAVEDATFFLFLDNRIGDENASNPPTLGGGVMDWVLTSGFVDTGLDIGLDENPVAGVVDVNASYSVFFRQVAAAEQFTFQEQNNGAARNMYGIAAVAPQITPVAFSASPLSINEGASTTLQWTVPVGATASIDQGVGPVSVDGVGVGSVSVSPTTTTTYTLTYVVGANPQVSLAPVTVTVIPSPVTNEPFIITSISVAANGDVTFSWPAPAGVTDPLLLTDVIERSTTLEVASWSVVPTAGATITAGVVTFTDTDPPAGGKAFYRIKRTN